MDPRKAVPRPVPREICLCLIAESPGKGGIGVDCFNNLEQFFCLGNPDTVYVGIQDQLSYAFRMIDD
jgi:hypothetical protein